ncbi:hypothetical protein CCZ01_05100 [Helicobacter monodelphidis]|uniref:peptidoglycan editing factor PgeF n=1 Tax=Helicobacter sp. 15-1451 TaxID=2004995 RepID=UPI000DCCDE8C|nr:peptidoglycan editing factor PgeF [Helicobacter sp. 15-1451]RAX57666.1 hypothetical protein CCZ01_05100 [Helicobacter sp. 15-1451]
MLIENPYAELKFILSNRFGGVSVGEFDSLNVAYHVGDSKENVYYNRQILLSKLESEKLPLVFMNQIHSNEVICVDKTILQGRQEVEVQGDALITNCPELALMVMVADCNPIVIYDTKCRILGVVHAGRRGVELQILTKTIQKMCNLFGSQPSDLYGYIGASIRVCCYEVQEDVYSVFLQNEYLAMGVVQQGEKYFLDLVRLLQMEWCRVGGLESALHICPICSSCCTDFYSYRRERNCGRFCLVAFLKPC